MISLLCKDFTLLNVIILCVQIFTPFIIYIISFCYITKDDAKMIHQKKHTFSFMDSTRGLVFGSVSFLFVGVSSLLLLDFYYKKNLVNSSNIEYKSSRLINIEYPSFFETITLILFPITILLSCVGRPISLQTKTFIPEAICTGMALLFAFVLSFYYFTKVSYIISTLMLPFIVWLTLNLVNVSQIIATPDS